MEVDLIILPKDSDPKALHLGIKHQIVRIFEKLYSDVGESSFSLDVKGEPAIISYKLSSKTANMLFVKLTCNCTLAKSAKIMDAAVNRLIQGEHRKSWNIVISYDEVSQLYCCKLMPLFGVFERRTRELVYITLIKTLGVSWYEKSFSQKLQNDLQGKARGNKTKLVEGALNELTYEQLKEYLFTPFSQRTLEDTLNNELTKENVDNLSKEDLAAILDNCRSVALWDTFFSKYEKFKDFRERIEKLQPHRNSVMHHKRITQTEYEKLRKELSSVNKRLQEAIELLEDEIYTETILKDVVAAFGNMCSKILGSTVSQWVNQMKPALASLGKLAIEAAMPQIDIPAILPSLTLGAEMAQQFHEVYQVPNAAIQAAVQVANSLPDVSYIHQANRIINAPGMAAAMHVAEEANRIKAMVDVPQLTNIASSVAAFDSPGLAVAREVAEQNRRIVQLLPKMPDLNIGVSSVPTVDEDAGADSSTDDEKKSED